MTTKRTLRRLLAEEKDKNRRLADGRTEAREDADTGQFNTAYLAQQVDKLREENNELARRLKAAAVAPPPAGWQRERSRLRRALDLSERARAALDDRVLQLGAANDRLNREAYDRAQGVTS
jgi:hypothetical protein